MADNKERNVKEENSSNDEDRQEPKLTWHLPEIIYITDSEEEGETESERSQEVIIISSDEENLEDKINDPDYRYYQLQRHENFDTRLYTMRSYAALSLLSQHYDRKFIIPPIILAAASVALYSFS